MVENYELEHVIQKQKRLYDEQCKKILLFKPILAYLFQCCLEECKDMSLEEIQDLLDEEQPHEKMISRNVEDQSVAGSMVRYDLLYKVRNPLNNQFCGSILSHREWIPVPMICFIEPFTMVQEWWDDKEMIRKVSGKMTLTTYKK